MPRRTAAAVAIICSAVIALVLHSTILHGIGQLHTPPVINIQSRMKEISATMANEYDNMHYKMKGLLKFASELGESTANNALDTIKGRLSVSPFEDDEEDFGPLTKVQIESTEGEIGIERLERICILIPTCSRGHNWTSVQESCLLRFPLSSLKVTYEPNFQYTVYVGYDAGDPFFDKSSTLESLKRWFNASFGFGFTLVTMRIENLLQKPGPVMNRISRQAYFDNCQYLYRINDDSEMLTPWATAFVDTLRGFSPPLLGAVGPTCHQGNIGILTHDFVHRTHWDIFQTHYPPELTDWWLDDWITFVYGEKRTRKLPDVVVGHRLANRRYEVGWEASHILPTLIKQGKEKISAFLEQKSSN